MEKKREKVKSIERKEKKSKRKKNEGDALADNAKSVKSETVKKEQISPVRSLVLGIYRFSRMMDSNMLIMIRLGTTRLSTNVTGVRSRARVDS